MKLRIVNTLMAGGAANAALRLHAGLLSSGVDSVFVTRDRRDSERNVVTAKTRPRALANRTATRITGWAGPSFGYRPYGLSDSPTVSECEIFSDCRGDYGTRLTDVVADCDVLNLHWIASFIDLPSLLEECAGKVPIVWTLHDMNPFTGGCHYDMNCQRFTSNCGNCPQLINRGPSDASATIFEKRQNALSRVRPGQLRIVTPSNWLMEQAQRSPILAPFCESVIPNGLDTNKFRPLNQSVAREFLGIPADARVLLFVADSLSAPRKGLDLLIEAIPEVCRIFPDLHLLCVGGSDPPYLKEIAASKTVLGRITNENLLAGIYSAADLFVLPSRQDNLPNTGVESLACGTPVVGFSTAGIPDIVRPGVTGWLAPQIDAAALAKTIVLALGELSDPMTSQKFRSSCRSIAATEYTLELQASRYIKLYQDSLKFICGHN